MTNIKKNLLTFISNTPFVRLYNNIKSYHVTFSKIPKIDRMIYLASELCISPTDWNLTKFELSPTKSKRKNLINLIIMILLLAGTIFQAITLVNDSIYSRIEFGSNIYNGTMMLFFACMSLTAITLRYRDIYTQMINQVYKIDNSLKEEFLTELEVDCLESRDKYILAFQKRTSRLLFVWAILGASTFYESSNPLRRYIYYPYFQIYFGFSTSAHELFIVILGAGFLRACLCYIEFTIFGTFRILETVLFWLSILPRAELEFRLQTTSEDEEHNNGSNKNISLEAIAKAFRLIALLCKLINDSQDVKIQFPILFIGGYIVLTFSFYGTIALFGVMYLSSYIVMLSTAICGLYVCTWICKTFEKINTLSVLFIKVWKLRQSKQSWFIKYLKSCQQINFSILNFFPVRNSTFLTLLGQAIDKAIILLLA